MGFGDIALWQNKPLKVSEFHCGPVPGLWVPERVV